MRDRILPNWIDSYMEYNADTESAKVFHKWVAISTVASALQKKVKLQLGRLKYFPNLYILLVSEPGIARKSQAINYGTELLREVDGVYMSANTTTRESLIEELQEARQTTDLGDGEYFEHASYTILAPEFESFMGQKKDNAKMVTLLTDLFDTSDTKAWEYKTKGSGTYEIPAVFMNLLGATTPDSLASSFPQAAVGGGLTSRMLFIWADRGEKKNYKPAWTPEKKNLKAKLITDLSVIHELAGTAELTQEAEDHWKVWYESFDEQDPTRLCHDPNFRLWYARKPLLIMKVAIILSAAEKNDLKIEWKHLEEAIDLVESTELTMSKAFRAFGKSQTAAETGDVIQALKEQEVLSESALLSLFWKDIDAVQFDGIIDTLIRMKLIKRVIKRGSAEIFYQYIGE